MFCETHTYIILSFWLVNFKRGLLDVYLHFIRGTTELHTPLLGSPGQSLANSGGHLQIKTASPLIPSCRISRI
jgi:hypothetical protein